MSSGRRIAERAREVMLLMEGAMAMILIHGDRNYANAAARAAKTLVSGHLPRRTNAAVLASATAKR